MSSFLGFPRGFSALTSSFCKVLVQWLHLEAPQFSQASPFEPIPLQSPEDQATSVSFCKSETERKEGPCHFRIFAYSICLGT